jgi:hypothetical protein
MQQKTDRYLFILLITIALFVSSFSVVFAQETDTIIPINEDPEKILRKIDLKGVAVHGFNFWRDKFSGHWAGVDFGFNSFLNTDYSGYDSEFMKNDMLRSNSYYINVFQKSFGLQRNRNTIGLVTGLGINFKSYRLDRNTTIERNEDNVVVPKYLYFDDNQKSKLSITSLSVPLLAEFQIPINHYNNRLYISTGMYFEYRLGSNTKIKYKKEHKEKLKVPDHYSMHDFKYGLMFRAGYRWINVFATYEITPLFKDEKGPVLTPFTVGFTLLQF